MYCVTCFAQYQVLLSSVCKIAKMAQGGVEMPKLNWANADQKSAFQEWKTMMSSYFRHKESA